MTINATRTRKYPELEKGSEVKIYRKKRTGEKERSSTWSQETYTLENITKRLGQTYFKTSQGDRLYMRHELLKVSWKDI